MFPFLTVVHKATMNILYSRMLSPLGIYAIEWYGMVYGRSTISFLEILHTDFFTPH